MHGVSMRHIAVIGLGYVGLGLATALSKYYTVFGYDISEDRITKLREGLDTNQLISRDELADCNIQYTMQIDDIANADFFIVSVPTPAYFFELPNFKPLILATKALAGILKKGDVVVYESTVYPGATEEVCLPLLESISGLKSRHDFHLGYSPERISPKDPTHNLKNITKIIGAQNDQALAVIRDVYEKCCDTVYPVSSIKTAEAVKILENTQRDVNIALMNEFSEIMHALDVNVHEVVSAAKTKWNFMPYKPGFAGGHCIAVDPLYLAFQARRFGIDPVLITAARKINDEMTQFVMRELINLLVKNDINVNHCSVAIFGITYKENVPDIRNSLALKFIKELVLAGFNCQVHDPIADKQYVYKKYNIELKELADFEQASAAIFIVGHDFYRDAGLKKIIENTNPTYIVMDIPNIFIDEAEQIKPITYWSL